MSTGSQAPTAADDAAWAALAPLLAAHGITLNADVAQKSLGALGLDSLAVVELQLELEQAMGLRLEDADAHGENLDAMTVAQLIALVTARLSGTQR